MRSGPERTGAIGSRPGSRGGRRRTCALALLLLIAMGFTLLASPAFAGERGQVNKAADSSFGRARKVLLVVIDRIGIEDITGDNAPVINSLIRRGSVALMNCRVRYDQYGQGSYVVIGAGGRAIGGFNVGLAFNHGELLQGDNGKAVSAGGLYAARTGRRSPPGSVVNLYIEEMKKKSDVPQASSLPGLLGQALKDGGKRVSVLGNADSLAPAQQVEPGYQVEFLQPVTVVPGSAPQVTLLHREISCIAMDENGLVPGGDVSADLYHNSNTAAGVTTAFGKLEAETSRKLASSDVVIADMGQTSRVDEQADFYSDAALARARAKALRQCDSALGVMLQNMDLSRDVVIVCAPTPTRKMILSNNLLTPLVIAGPGFSPGTRLASPSTRRTGVVSNFDVAPTVMDVLGLKPAAEMDGRPVESGSAKSDLAGLQRYSERATGASACRKTMVRVYTITSMSLAGLLFVVMLLREDTVRRRRFFWTFILLAILAGPLIFLIVPSFAVPALWWLVAAEILGCALLGGLLSLMLLKLRQPPSAKVDTGEEEPDCSVPGLWTTAARPLAVLCGATLAVVLVDMVFGGRLMSFSAFGSDVMMGDRYYGMGNLYSGFAIGAALLFACLLPVVLGERLDKPWKRYALSGAVLAVTAFILGFGRIGADFGGLLMILTGSLIALMKFDGGRIGLKRAAVIVTVIVVCVVLFVGLDIMLPGAASHAGRAVSGAAGSRGVGSLFTTAGRKLALNWTLTFTSIWRLLLLILFVACMALNWRYHLFRRLKGEVPYLYAAFVGMAVAIPVGWLVNDSGIEAAAALSVFLFVPYLYLLVWSLKQRDALPDDS